MPNWTAAQIFLYKRAGSLSLPGRTAGLGFETAKALGRQRCRSRDGVPQPAKSRPRRRQLAALEASGGATDSG